jgi:methionyl aminopeptidase
MVIAVEPMVTAGRPGVRVLSDGWTAVTKDGSRAAHFEHTIAVTRDGFEALTLLPQDRDRARQLQGAAVRS